MIERLLSRRLRSFDEVPERWGRAWKPLRPHYLRRFLLPFFCNGLPLVFTMILTRVGWLPFGLGFRALPLPTLRVVRS